MPGNGCPEQGRKIMWKSETNDYACEDDGNRKADIRRPNTIFELADEDFDRFEHHVREWSSRLSMGSWELYVFFDDVENTEALDGNKAIVFTDIDGKTASIVLNRVWRGTEPTDRNLEKCALHECLEVLMAEPEGEKRTTERIHTVVRSVATALMGTK